MFQVKKAQLSDLDKIKQIELTSFEGSNWSIQTLRNELSSTYAFYFVAINESNEIVGYAGYWKILDEGHITSLAVVESYRRNGVADKLIYTIREHARRNQIKWLTLEVRASNDPAINLYKKHNFSQLGIRKKYYQSNNEDAIILWSDRIDTSDK